MMVLPWTPKIIYGIMSDTFPIFGSRKKSYLIIMGLLQTITCILLAIVEFESATSVAWLVTAFALSTAFSDVVVDGLMVGQCRLDPDYGSEDLQTISWVSLGLGGIIGSISGGLITEYTESRYVFYVCAIFGVLITAQACSLNKQIEASD
jgi:MFS family permease